VFAEPHYPPSGPRLRSQFVPDEVANPHIRFPTLAANIRSRRGRKVQVNVPVFKDAATPSPWRDPTVRRDLHDWPEDEDVRSGGAAPDDHIHMDAMVFGMGSCCLQITFQAKNIVEGRRMYDQLSPVGPVMLALTAATPIYKGFLADTDVRWNQISRAVDDRTPEEMGEKVGSSVHRERCLQLTSPTAPRQRPLAHPKVALRVQFDVHLDGRAAARRVPRPGPRHRPGHQAVARRRRHGRPAGNALCAPLYPRPHCRV
jgi:hypothetical protein